MSNQEAFNTNDATLLFRREVFREQGKQNLGVIQVDQSISARVVAGVSLALASGMLTFIINGSVARKCSVGGIVVPSNGSITVTALQAGSLTRIFVVEGEKVKRGTKLFEISTERLSSSGEITELIAKQLHLRKAALDNNRHARVAQSSEKQQVLRARLQNLSSEHNHLDNEIQMSTYRTQLAEQTLQKFRALQKSGFVSDAQIQQKEEELLDSRARVSSLHRARIQLEAEQLNAASELRNLGASLSTDLAMLDKEAAALQQELLETLARKSVIVSAPEDGIVTTITYQTGQFLNASQPLATIVAEKEITASGNGVEVHLYAPSRTAGFVAPGQPVMLRFDAFPYQKFGLQRGTVTSVSRTPFAPNELPANLATTILSNEERLSGGGNEGLYRIKVKLVDQSIRAYDGNYVLIPGMTVSGDIIQERRKIWEWIAEPALAIGKRL